MVGENNENIIEVKSYKEQGEERKMNMDYKYYIVLLLIIILCIKGSSSQEQYKQKGGFHIQSCQIPRILVERQDLTISYSGYFGSTPSKTLDYEIDISDKVIDIITVDLLGLFEALQWSGGDVFIMKSKKGFYKIKFNGVDLGGVCVLPKKYKDNPLDYLRRFINSNDEIVQVASLYGLGEFSTDDEILKILINSVNDSMFIEVITKHANGPLKEGVNKKLLVGRLIKMLDNKEDKFIYHVPALLGEIEDPLVIDTLISLIDIKDGKGSLIAEHRAATAIRGLGNIGDERVLKKLLSLTTVGDLKIDNNEWLKKEIEEAINKLKQKFKKF